jgi:hypothetical protein
MDQLGGVLTLVILSEVEEVNVLYVPNRLTIGTQSAFSVDER